MSKADENRQLPRRHASFAGLVSRGNTQEERDEWFRKNQEEGQRIMRELIASQAKGRKG